ncbi:hypothetical protein [Kutzneria sp. NPDC051319]|uniref:hypothetical protein n=1 Tax=Kutzneria sp. NPDC051319 TaxID=3155047 RepID=UPI0034447517
MPRIVANHAEPPEENEGERVPGVARSSRPDRVLVIVWSNPAPVARDNRQPGQPGPRLAGSELRPRGGRHRRPSPPSTLVALTWRLLGNRRRFGRVLKLVVLVVGLTVLGGCAILATLFLTGGDVLTHMANVATIAVMRSCGR